MWSLEKSIGLLEFHWRCPLSTLPTTLLPGETGGLTDMEYL